MEHAAITGCHAALVQTFSIRLLHGTNARMRRQVWSLHVWSLHVWSLHVWSLHVWSLHVWSLHVWSLHVWSLHVRSLHVRSPPFRFSADPAR
jgi:hypothetical protein